MTTNTRTERMTIPARQLRRADRIVNLVSYRTVTTFDLEIVDDVVAIFPAQADLDAGVGRRINVDGGVHLVVDRELTDDYRPVQPAVEPAPVAKVIVRGRPYTARRELVGDGVPGPIVVRNRWGGDCGTVQLELVPLVIGCPRSWSGGDSRRAAREILEQLGERRPARPKTLGEMTEAERAAAVRNACRRLEAELTANADAIGAALEAPLPGEAPAAPAKLPTPKGPGHPALRNGRVQVDVGRPNPRGGFTVYRTGRFVTEKAAVRWAEGVRGAGERASITFYSPSDGWQSHAGANLTDDGWRTTAYLDGRGGDPLSWTGTGWARA